MSETKAGESVSAETSESATTVEIEANTESEIVVDRPPEELARKLKSYANENEQRRKAEKALKKQLEDAQAKLKTAEEAKLKEQGQWQQAYESSKKELDEAQKKLKQMHSTFAYKTVTSQIKEQAVKNGCVDTEAMIKLAAANGLLDSLEPDDEFNLSAETVKTIVADAQKSMPYLFGKPAPVVRDGQPTNKPNVKSSFESIPLKDKARQLAELLSKQRQ
jgi:hypothetical protein